MSILGQLSKLKNVIFHWFYCDVYRLLFHLPRDFARWQSKFYRKTEQLLKMKMHSLLVLDNRINLMCV